MHKTPSHKELIEQTRALIEEARELRAWARKVLEERPCWDAGSGPVDRRPPRKR